MNTLQPVKGHTGVFSRQSAYGDTAYYVSVKKLTGKWTFRGVGKKSEGMTPAKAIIKRVHLQESLSKKKDPKVNEKVSFQEAYLHHLKLKEAGRKDITRDEERWRAHLVRYAATPLSRLSTVEFNDHLIELRKRGLSEGYLEKVFGQARTIIGVARRGGLWDGTNPLGKDSNFVMPSWSRDYKPTRWFYPQEAKCLLEAIRKRSVLWYDMSLLSLHTGMRDFEIWSLGEQEDAIDERNGILNFIGKSGKREFVEVDKGIVRILKKYQRSPCEVLFKNRKGEKIYKTSKTFQMSAIEIGVYSSKTHKVWFYSWRRAYPVVTHTG